MNSRIYYTKPSITDLEISYANDAASHGWGEKCYEYINRFEENFKHYLGVKHAIATSSCTGALHMGLHALGIGPGDEVILADSNWIATVSPVVHVGATPVLVDILPNTWCLNPEQVESAITSKTKAIIAVHLYGNLCEMDALLSIGEKYHIPVIEDSAEAIGSVYHGRRAGSMGKFGVFSFHGTKTLTTGEGGMFVTNDAELYQTTLTLSNHGRDQNQSKQFWPEQIGFKYKMSNTQAAIGCAQLERVEELVARKREILVFYKEALKKYNQLKMNPEYDNTINGAWMPTVVFDPQSNITTEKLVTAYQEENIDARVFFHPLSQLPMFINHKTNHYANMIANHAINLPSYHDITENELDRIISVIERLIERENNGL